MLMIKEKLNIPIAIRAAGAGIMGVNCSSRHLTDNRRFLK